MPTSTLAPSRLRSLAGAALALGARLGCTPSPPPAATAPSYLYEPENVPPAASTWDASNWGTYRGR